MIRIASLILVSTLVAAIARPASADGIHIRYGADAPEKLAVANVGYYQGLMTMDERHPIAFAEEHPFYTKMFHDQALFDKELALWEAHPQRFEFWHYCLWKVLDGYLNSHGDSSGSTAFPTGSTLTSMEGQGGSAGPGGSNNSGGLGGSGTPGGDHGGNGGGGGLGGATVPEPSAGLLITVSLAFAAGWSAQRRFRFRAASPIRVDAPSA